MIVNLSLRVAGASVANANRRARVRIPGPAHFFMRAAVGILVCAPTSATSILDIQEPAWLCSSRRDSQEDSKTRGTLLTGSCVAQPGFARVVSAVKYVADAAAAAAGPLRITCGMLW